MEILDGRVSCWLCKLECLEETTRRRAAILRTFQHRDGTMTEKNRKRAELYAARCLGAQPDAPHVVPPVKTKTTTQQLLPGAGPPVLRKKTRKPYKPLLADRTDFRLSEKGFRVVTESTEWGLKTPEIEEEEEDTSKIGFYAVRKGRTPGVYKSWAKCSKEVMGFPGAEFKRFDNPWGAERYLQPPVQAMKQMKLQW